MPSVSQKGLSMPESPIRKLVPYAENAKKNGAKVILREAEVFNKIFSYQGDALIISCSTVRSSVGRIAAKFYSKPAINLDIIGITGTNGKTSCSYYLAQAFKFCDKSCCIIGTLGNGFIGNLSTTGNTTPGAIEIQKCLSKYRKQNVTKPTLQKRVKVQPGIKNNNISIKNIQKPGSQIKVKTKEGN